MRLVSGVSTLRPGAEDFVEMDLGLRHFCDSSAWIQSRR